MDSAGVWVMTMIVVTFVLAYLTGRREGRALPDADLDNLIVRAHHVTWRGVHNGCGHFLACEICRHERRLTIPYLQRLEDALARYRASGRYQAALDRWSASEEGGRKPTLRDEYGRPLCRECEGETLATDEMRPDDVVVMTDILGSQMDGSKYEYRYCRPCRSRQIVERAS